jgi:tetratricopeptide (TPR) repeat protein
VLPPDESVDLLGRMLGERVAAEPNATAQLAGICAHLPLALRIAGAGLVDQPRRAVADYVAELTESGPVAVLAVDGGADVAVRGAFDLSYQAMPQPARQVFRRLGLVPCADFTAGAAAALAGSTEAEARQVLDRLAAAHLVVQHRPGRYTLHDLLRQYAADRAATEDSPSQRLAAAGRLYEWFVAMSVTATELISPEVLRLPAVPKPQLARPGLTDPRSALDWLEVERHNLVAAILHAARQGPRSAAWMCADALRGYFDQRRHLADWLSTSRAAVAAARAEGDPCAQAAAYLGLAHTHFALGNYRRSITYLRHTIALATEARWFRAVATASTNLGIALIVQGRTTESIESLNRALQVHERIGWPVGQAKAMESLANAFRDVGRLHEGRDLAIRARTRLQAAGTALSTARADASLGELYALLGHLDDAAQLLASALSTLREFGSRSNEAMCLAWLARVHCDMGRLDEAGESAHAAVDLADEIDEPRPRAAARHALALVHQASGDQPGAILLNQAALTIAEQGDIRYSMGEALLGLASAYRGHGDHHLAIDHAARAMTLAQSAGFAVIEGRAHTTLGRVHHQLGHATRALTHANRALTNHRRTGYRIGEADSHLLLATIHQHLGDHTTADHHASTAWSLYQQIGAHTERTAAMSGLAVPLGR